MCRSHWLTVRFSSKLLHVERVNDIFNFFVFVNQAAAKELAKMRETAEKIRRAKEAKEKADKERKEKMARKKALVDITAGG